MNAVFDALATKEGRPDACLRVRVLAGGCSGFTSSTGLVCGTGCPACLSMRASCMLMPLSVTTRQAGESTSREVTRTSSALSLSASFMKEINAGNATEEPVSFLPIARQYARVLQKT